MRDVWMGIRRGGRGSTQAIIVAGLVFFAATAAQAQALDFGFDFSLNWEGVAVPTSIRGSVDPATGQAQYSVLSDGGSRVYDTGIVENVSRYETVLVSGTPGNPFDPPVYEDQIVETHDLYWTQTINVYLDDAVTDKPLSIGSTLRAGLTVRNYILELETTGIWGGGTYSKSVFANEGYAGFTLQFGSDARLLAIPENGVGVDIPYEIYWDPFVGSVYAKVEFSFGIAGTDAFVRSEDLGWEEPTITGLVIVPVLNTNATSDSGSDIFVAIETDGFGDWVTAWRSNDDLSGTIETDYDILTARSSDNGVTWTAPAALNTNAATDGANDLWPPVLRTNRSGVWIAAWPSLSDLGGTIGTDRDILFARSTDNGATWSEPAPIDANAASDSGIDDRVTLGYGDGVFVALWQSDDGASGPDLDIMVSRSSDGGLTWSPAVPLNSNATTDFADDSWPTVASDGMGSWVAVWESDESLIGGDGDLLTSRSGDGGATWTAPAVLNSNAMSDVGSDDRPRLATDGFGTWLVVWDSDDDLGGTIGTDRDVLFARSTDEGATWTGPTALDSAATTDFGDEINPDPATDMTGSWTVVWESDEGGVLGTDFDLIVSRSSDDGLTWSTGASLNPDAETDIGGDYFPRIATQPAGSSVVAWHSDENKYLSVGADWDLFFVDGLTSDAVADCDLVGPLAQTTGSLGVAENHFCEDWSLVSQPAADLRDSFLAKIDLSGANLDGALLHRSNLFRADLSNASLFNANLTQAILVGADLSSADLEFARLDGAVYDGSTVFPSGFPYYWQIPVWGLGGGVSPWNAGMIPAPEPSVISLLTAGVATLIGLARVKRNGQLSESAG